MKTTAAKPMSQLERYILLTFGVLLTAVGVYFFKFPNNFSTGGVSGLSLILGRMLPSPVLTPSVFVFIINMALLVVGFIFLGRDFAFSTVYCSVVLSLSVNVMERAVDILKRCAAMQIDSDEIDNRFRVGRDDLEAFFHAKAVRHVIDEHGFHQQAEDAEQAGLNAEAEQRRNRNQRVGDH